MANDLRQLYVHMRERAREEKAVKERLRQLRREVDADREPEELPLLTEEDAGEVLDEAQVEVEGALVVPDGFKVSDPNLTKRREPRGTPCSSALPSPTASDAGDNSPRASEASSVLLPAPSVASSAPSDESEYIEGQAYMTYPIRRR